MGPWELKAALHLLGMHNDNDAVSNWMVLKQSPDTSRWVTVSYTCGRKPPIVIKYYAVFGQGGAHQVILKQQNSTIKDAFPQVQKMLVRLYEEGDKDGHKA